MSERLPLKETNVTLILNERERAGYEKLRDGITRAKAAGVRLVDTFFGVMLADVDFLLARVEELEGIDQVVDDLNVMACEDAVERAHRVAALEAENARLREALADADVHLSRMYGIVSGNNPVFPNNWTLQALECIRRIDAALHPKEPT